MEAKISHDLGNNVNGSAFATQAPWELQVISFLHPYFWSHRKQWSPGLHLNLGHNFFSLLLKSAKILDFSL